MGTGDYQAQLNLDIRIKRTFLVYSWVSKYLLEMDLILSSVVNKIQGLNIQYNGSGILTGTRHVGEEAEIIKKGDGKSQIEAAIHWDCQQSFFTRNVPHFFISVQQDRELLSAAKSTTGNMNPAYY
ncbi:unnamed protein product [Caretta caretta]